MDIKLKIKKAPFRSLLVVLQKIIIQSYSLVVRIHKEEHKPIFAVHKKIFL